MRVLVTGEAGFLGSHLCERLLADGLTATVNYLAARLGDRLNQPERVEGG